jgi:hypothetical protein
MVEIIVIGESPDKELSIDV